MLPPYAIRHVHGILVAGHDFRETFEAVLALYKFTKINIHYLDLKIQNLRRQCFGCRNIWHSALMFQCDAGVVRFGKTETTYKDSFASLCRSDEPCHERSSIAQSLYLIDYRVLNVTG